MKILIACEYSGTVRDTFLKRGHDAMSCDILPTESAGPHYQGDIFDILYDNWDMMIAHPPCTYLSNAGARFLYPEGRLDYLRYKKGIAGKSFFMRLYNSRHIPKICVENPVSSTVFNMPQYSQQIQPYDFGHPVQKKTRLWLKGLPPLFPTDILSERQSSKIAGNWFNKGGTDRQKNRALFFQGWADAMAEQWG